MKTYNNIYDEIASLPNLFLAWEEFRVGKKNKKDVLEFEWHLEENIVKLYRDLRYHRYKHDVYTSFYITDPKRRKIHKATVRDRILHHAVFRIVNPVFEPTFIASSFSCRIGKGNHRGVYFLEKLIRSESRNFTKPAYILKCDVRKFFDSINHKILLSVILKKIKDEVLTGLFKEIIGSFDSESICAGTQIEREREREREISCRRQESLFSRKGIPIGNLTSQLFANIYMNEFDQFVKHELKVKKYVRYTDDFVIVSSSLKYLNDLLPKIQTFLNNELKLELHPSKISIRKAKQGVDFLGYVILPWHTLLRTRTKKRMIRRVNSVNLSSYMGLLRHCKGKAIEKKITMLANLPKGE